jgi:beta-apo-4'-carotenal oxygenase
MGAYRGRASFDVFVHRRPYTTTPSWMESLLDMRYPPYLPTKEKMINITFGGTPDFDRDGRQSRLRWLQYLLGGTPKAAAGRAAIVAVGK